MASRHFHYCMLHGAWPCHESNCLSGTVKLCCLRPINVIGYPLAAVLALCMTGCNGAVMKPVKATHAGTIETSCMTVVKEQPKWAHCDQINGKQFSCTLLVEPQCMNYTPTK